MAFANRGEKIFFEVTTNGGRTWAIRQAPRILGNSLSCPTVTHCLAVGDAGFGNTSIFATSDGGVNWKRLANDPEPSLGGTLLCTAVSECYLVASLISPPESWMYLTHNFGKTWSSVPIHNNYVNDLKCPTNLACVYSSWPHPGPTSLGFLRGDPPKIADVSTLPSQYPYAYFDCSTARICVLASQNPPLLPYNLTVLMTSDAGHAWAVQRLPAGVREIQELGCSRVACFAEAVDRSSHVILIVD
jgi:photosystem II stability/assembly factor-like uncharacterized protein